MKNYYFVVAAAAMLCSCEGSGRVITGETGALEGDRIYIYEPATGYGAPTVLDSAVVEEGRFRFEHTGLTDGLVLIGTSPDKGGYVFLDGDRVELLAGVNGDGRTEWIVSGSPSDALYRDFLKRQYVATERQTTDSLDNLFYAARDAGDRAEMARIKEESMEYYERGRENEKRLVTEMTSANMDNPFGAYLYYAYTFRRTDFPTPEDVAGEREYLAKFGPRAQATDYFTKMNAALAKYENCAIGAVAPEISGTDTLGNQMKLSDLRGNYVIVDFWDSYCHWCREETPHLLKALDKFRGRNFRILGVSDDREKQRWLDAIHEDGSHWDHMILPADNKIFDTYCIKGIPHIILVDPEGVILAKELRWDDHITVTEKFMDKK